MRWSILIMALLICSCATQNNQALYDSLNRGMGVLTYDQALTTWGSPTAITEGDEILIATWSASRTAQVVMPLTGVMGTTYVGVPVQHGWEMRLTFNKVTRRLQYWTYRDW